MHRLLELLAKLRDAHNTILVVEHHPAVIAAADHVIDLGPAGGADGGRVQFEGRPGELTATGPKPAGFSMRRFASGRGSPRRRREP